MKSSRRELLITTAQDLFNENGIRATGIDKILAQSGVAKKTLYNHFESKDALILETLKKQNNDFLENIEEATNRFIENQEGESDSRLAYIMAMFDALEEWFGRDNFRGSASINASAEYPTPGHPIRNICANHTKLLFNHIVDKFNDLSLPHSEKVANEICLLIDGSIVSAFTRQRPENVKFAKNMAKSIILEAIKNVGEVESPLSKPLPESNQFENSHLVHTMHTESII